MHHNLICPSADDPELLHPQRAVTISDPRLDIRRRPPARRIRNPRLPGHLALIEAGLGISLVPASVLGHGSRPGIAYRQVEGMSLARAIYLVRCKPPTVLVTDVKTMITDLNPIRNRSAGASPLVYIGDA